MENIKNKIIELRHLHDESTKTFEKVFGKLKEPQYDKTEFDFSTLPACHNLHDIIYFRHHKGVYGSSVVSAAFNSKLSNYIAAAINEIKLKIFDRAIELINSDIVDSLSDLKQERENLDAMIKELENKKSI